MIEHIISIIAPHLCVSCSAEENRLLCRKCAAHLPWEDQRCYRCDAARDGSLSCTACLRYTPLQAVHVRTLYEGAAKSLLWKLKFDRAKSAAQEIAQLLPCTIRASHQNVLIVPLPTATSRIRHRGYDQAVLIAKAFAKIHGYTYGEVVARTGQHRQVGADREQRFLHAEHMFRIRDPHAIQNKTIIIIDDVITTGASIEAVARLLDAAGAAHIEAVVFARAQPEVPMTDR